MYKLQRLQYEHFPQTFARASDSEYQTNCMFASVGAKAIQYVFFSREARGLSLMWLVIETNDYEHPNIGPYKAVRILVDQSGKYQFQIQFTTLHSGHVDDGTIDVYLNQMRQESQYTFCPGVERVYDELKHTLKRKPNTLREWPGLKRMDNVDCKLWYNK